MTQRRADDFPIAATIAGVPVVTIPAADYAELLAYRRQLAESQVRQRGFKLASTGRIERDPEVARLIGIRHRHPPSTAPPAPRPGSAGRGATTT